MTNKYSDEMIYRIAEAMILKTMLVKEGDMCSYEEDDVIQYYKRKNKKWR